MSRMRVLEARQVPASSSPSRSASTSIFISWQLRVSNEMRNYANLSIKKSESWACAVSLCNDYYVFLE